jgi:glutathione synthase/RimK-type ligase-like ATP-grasp enzyme
VTVSPRCALATCARLPEGGDDARMLAAAGLPVVPTRWDPDDIPADWPEFVIKPSVSSGSRDSARWGPGEEDAAHAHLRDLRDAGRTVMLQPYLEAVDTAGETALVFCAGEFSHAGRKARVLDPGAGIEGLDGLGETRGKVTAATATGAELDVARRVLAAVPGAPDLLYARVDLVPGPDGAPLLIELELTEPALYFEHGPGSPDVFAKAIAARLG